MPVGCEGGEHEAHDLGLADHDRLDVREQAGRHGGPRLDGLLGAEIRVVGCEAHPAAPAQAIVGLSRRIRSIVVHIVGVAQSSSASGNERCLRGGTRKFCRCVVRSTEFIPCSSARGANGVRTPPA